MATLEGWRGHFFEDFHPGDMLEHRMGRTITTNDNIWFTLLTMNQNPIHLNQDYARRTEFGKPLVNSTLTLAVVTGLSVADLSQNAINLGWENVRLPAPVFEGDTIYARTQILATRPSNSRPNMGVVRARSEGYNQDDTVVLESERTILVYKRHAAPGASGTPETKA